MSTVDRPGGGAGRAGGGRVCGGSGSPTAPAGPGRRPVIADSRILAAGAEVIKVYCPDRPAGYRERFDALKTADRVDD